MAQMTWRATDDLAARVRAEAARRGQSMNDYVSTVLDAATNPDLAGDDVTMLRERLARAGLLAAPGHQRKRPPRASVRQARRAAAKGPSLSRLVDEGR